MSTQSKRKGREGQNEVYQIFLDNGFQPHELTKALMGESGADIKVHRPNWNWDVEVKRKEKLNIWEALEQSSKRGDPLVFFRRNNGKWYVAMEAEDFMKRFGNQL